MESAAPFANLAAVEVDPGHARLRGEWHERRRVRREFASADTVFLLREHDDGSPLRRFVCKRGELRGIGQLAFASRRRRQELGRLAVAKRDRARLVEQQRVDVAGGLDGASGHGEHVVLNKPVHPGDADGGEQAADRRRNQTDQQRHQHEYATAARPSRSQTAAA